MHFGSIGLVQYPLLGLAVAVHCIETNQMAMGSGGGALDGRANPSRTRYGGSLDEEQNPTPNEMIKYGCVPLVLSYSQTCAHGLARRSGSRAARALRWRGTYRISARCPGTAALTVPPAPQNL